MVVAPPTDKKRANYHRKRKLRQLLLQIELQRERKKAAKRHKGKTKRPKTMETKPAFPFLGILRYEH
mgnify:CR=1 FL=1|tara:strand:- start:14266 stop:14466 length:201 start_codon:yes stop_codon:yes gene_type:complete